MKSLSPAGLALIKEFEGVRLKAYLDSVNIPTIGYGHIKGVKMGDVCTQAQADKWLQEDTASAVAAVNKAAGYPVNQAQFDAMVSLAFNIGNGAFSSSTLVRKLNSSDLVGASNEFPRWNKAGGRVIDGLTRRRAAERDMFLGLRK